MIKPKNFAPQEIWDSSHKEINNLDSLINYQDPIVKFIYDNCSRGGDNSEYFELGCYPGRYMYHFGKLGYRLNGIDNSSELDNKFISWFDENKFKIGRIEKADLFSYSFDSKFDFVTSFGLIEHFSNFQDLIELHFKICKPGGTVLIIVPDFSNPVQYFLHKYFDAELLSIHNLDAMNPANWKPALEKQNIQVLFNGYFGGFDFWHGQQKRNMFQKTFLYIFRNLNRRFFSKIKTSSRYYSPYYGIIAKKKI